MDLHQLLRRTGHSINNNSTTILTAAAVAGVVTTAILAAKAAPQASGDLAEAVITKNQKLDDFNDPGWQPLTLVERFSLTWRSYLPSVAVGAATIACIVGANHIGLRRNAALAGAYTIADAAFREYKEEVVKVIGKNKAQAVEDEVAKHQIEENPLSDQQVIITGGGDQLCYDRFTGRYFHSDIETLRQIANSFNQNILGGDMYGSLNDFYALVGLADTVVGSEVGFSVDNLVKLVFSSHLAQDGRPCLAMGFEELPRASYGSF